MVPYPVRLYRRTETWEKHSNDAPAYNVAPTDLVPFVAARQERQPEASRGPLVAGSVVGEGDAETGDVQHPDRDG